MPPRHLSDSESGDEERYERRSRGNDRDRPRKSVHLSTWFIDGKGIDRQVLQSNIQRHLGPEAVSQPTTQEVTMFLWTRDVTTNMGP